MSSAGMDLFVTLVDQNEPSPEQLAERCKAGCSSSFECLVDQFEGRIFNFLYQLTRNRQDAEDLAQETFVKAYRNIHRYEPAYAFATWLFTIAKRTAFSHLRASRPTVELGAEVEIDAEDPGVLLEQKDERNSLWRLARTLKPKQYEALWLRYGEGFSIAETAQVMNTNQIHVKVLLHRARSALAKTLARSGSRNV
ncbi:MAG: RNA polymerase sigma factor [Verrucomicrobia bacterium]|nr:RNA polymerase sigma factor [Verrucomicrobiota bacterium]